MTAMESADGDLLKSVGILDHLADLQDARRLIKVAYPLDEILLRYLLTVLARAETITDIADFGKHKLDFLRRFRPFANGTPAHDCMGEVFAALDAEQFQMCFVNFAIALTGLPADVIAVDRKTSRRSKKGDVSLVHMVSAPAANQRGC